MPPKEYTQSRDWVYSFGNAIAIVGNRRYVVSDMGSCSWTDEDLIAAVAGARSRRQVLIALGIKAKGGNYATIKYHMQRLNLDTSHFTGFRME